MQCFAGQQPRCAANAGRDALPQMVAVTACFASLAKAQTVRRVSAGVSAHSRGAERCSVEETSFGSGQRASGAFASTRWTVMRAADY